MLEVNSPVQFGPLVDRIDPEDGAGMFGAELEVGNGGVGLERVRVVGEGETEGVTVRGLAEGEMAEEKIFGGKIEDFEESGNGVVDTKRMTGGGSGLSMGKQTSLTGRLKA